MKRDFAMKINRKILALSPSSTLAITAKAKELKAQGRDIINFAAGEPDFDTPDNIKNAAIKAIKDGFTKYTPSVGTPQLREAICAKFKRDNQLGYKPNQVVVSCGAKHSLFNIIQVLVDEGDEVLIPSPYWVSYPEMVKLAGGVSRFIQTTKATNFKITPDLLKENLTSNSRVLILNSPSNPTGMVYSKNELKSIAEICVKKKILVVSDEIYEKLVYGIKEYTSIASLDSDIYNLTITVNGVSKAYSMTGWRIGYCAGPQEVINHIKNLQDHTTSNPTSISQMAALEAINSPVASIQAMCEEFKRRRDALMAGIDEIPEISYIRPEGAFYLFCDVSAIGKADDIAKRILDEAGVALIPGESFGAPGYIRLSFATSLDKIKEGTKRIAQWVKNQVNSSSKVS